MRSGSKACLVLIGVALGLLPWYLILGRLQISAFGTDFRFLHAAAQAIWQLRDPYGQSPGYLSPPWMLLALAPLSLLPVQVAYLLWTLLGIAAYWVAFQRMGMSWQPALILLLSPLVVGNLIFGNYDWLILLGATLPPALGIWCITVKPQLGLVLAGLWSWTSFRRGVRALAALILPIGIAALVSFLLGYHLPGAEQMYWSTDIWPWGIPAGAVLTYVAFRRQDPLLALAAAPFLSPYVLWHSWIVLLLPLHKKSWLLGIGILASWVWSAWVFTR